MVITRDEARNVIRESKKKMKNQDYCEPVQDNLGHSPTKEDKRKSVKDMVQLMSNQIPTSSDMNTDDKNYHIGSANTNQPNYNIPSISVTANGPIPPPVPPLPQGY